jgi:hypothetical protein
MDENNLAHLPVIADLMLRSCQKLAGLQLTSNSFSRQVEKKILLSGSPHLMAIEFQYTKETAEAYVKLLEKVRWTLEILHFSRYEDYMKYNTDKNKKNHIEPYQDIDIL